MAAREAKPVSAYLVLALLASATLAVSACHYAVWFNSGWRIYDTIRGIEEPAVAGSGITACAVALLTVVVGVAVTVFYRERRHSRFTAGALVAACALLVVATGLMVSTFP